ncbi:succinate dehydrogenase/fumarate reductase iron-sulfur subunit [Candidatus Leptofilum sp.]|uniref:succinate dehydrogenase/fumarate reductase iron-sulfur subunit n=1 Tax=Candidatus Leptofilum sp. TaxID=3241576 RepID=UPI003B5AE05F
MVQNGQAKTATVRIQRFNPDVNRKPYLDEYTIEVTPETTILDALETIKSFQDGSVTFRRSCRHAICGSCAMNINGKNMLVCNQPLREHLDRKGRVTIRPLPYLPIIKDLVVDRSVFWEQYIRVKPWLVPPETVPEREFRVSPEEVAALNNAEKCIMCGACYSACTVTAMSKNYIGPAALLKAFLRILDPRDSIPAERLAEVGGDQGVYRCHTIFNCIDACPKGLDPTKAIEAMRGLAMKRMAFEEARQARQETINEPIPLNVIR